MKSIRVKVPATTANLGPGFDALGLAVNLWNEAEFAYREDGQIVVSVRGERAEQLPTDQNNAIARAALQVFERAGKIPPGLQINCTNRIPLGSGLGSSSAAILSGMMGANALIGNPFSEEEILHMAVTSEGHPDNIAPAKLGGLVVSTPYQGSYLSVRLPVSPIQVTVVLPEFNLPTSQARAILPDKVNRADAVANLSRVALVIEAFRSGDLRLLGTAMEDSLHQPYRLPLIPGAQAALDAAKSLGAAAALSGAGPSVVAFSNPRQTQIGKSMQDAFAEAGLNAQIFELEISKKGAEVIEEYGRMQPSP